MKPAPVGYLRPRTLEEALEALAAHPEAKVLAGGQSLVPLLSMRLAAPSVLVDINGLPDLDHVHADPGGPQGARCGVRVGALARHTDVAAHPAARQVQPLLAEALGYVAHATVRNRGTVVGSLVHADPAAELPAVLCLLEGHLRVRSTAGQRTVPVAELYDGPMQSTLRHDELAVEAFFPALAADAGTGFAEVSRRHGDYALAGVAAVVALDAEGACTSARLGYLSVADVPTALDVTSAVAGGPSDAAVAEAAERALDVLDPQSDIHASAAYRTQLVRVLTGRVLRAGFDQARARTRHPESA